MRESLPQAHKYSLTSETPPDKNGGVDMGRRNFLGLIGAVVTTAGLKRLDAFTAPAEESPATHNRYSGHINRAQKYTGRSETNHPEAEPRITTITWCIENNTPFSADDGPALAQAAYKKQKEHLQSYDERNQADDFSAAALRIKNTHPEDLIHAFDQYNLPPEVALGLPVQESFFQTREVSRSDALGTHQIKLSTASSIIAQDEKLSQYRNLSQDQLKQKLLTDPIFSAKVSAAILAAEKDVYTDDMLAITAYNTGRSLAGARSIMLQEALPLTYENFTKIMAGKIKEIAQKMRAENFYTIQKGDTFSELQRRFPDHSTRNLLALIGGSKNLRSGAKTRIPLESDAILAQKIIRAAHAYIEPLEYAAKVRAAGDLLKEEYAELFSTRTPLAQQ